jgi:hypothetical protein
MKGDTKSNGEEITLQMVMSHMQNGFSNLRREIKMDMQSEIARLEKKVDVGFADLQDRWRWLESHDLPKRVSRLEDKVFAGIELS